MRHNGASTATFVYGNGEVVTLDGFYVFVLHQDPVDCDPNSRYYVPVMSEDATDPTGTVFWRSLWATQGSLPHWQIFQHRKPLKNCFTEFKRRIRDVDSYLQVEIEFKRAFGIGPDPKAFSGLPTIPEISNTIPIQYARVRQHAQQ